MNLKEVNHVAIYPPVGIARIGNSPEYFLTSDLPGIPPEVGDPAPSRPDRRFKDAQGRIKKQVQRFRIYAFDQHGKVLGELTEDQGAAIEWRVHIANLKAAWYAFNNALDMPGDSIPSTLRNAAEPNRAALVINPGSRTISGKNRQGSEYRFDTGTFFGKPVSLGELRTDETGRLLFFGGEGHSASKDNTPPTTFANNEGWHDDTSDGVVRATVSINGKKLEAVPAMVAVAPPNYGHGLFGAITMNDVAEDLFIREMNYPDRCAPDAGGVQFWRDIYPVFERMSQTQWVNHGFFMLFGKNSPSDFTQRELLEKLADPAEAARSERMRVFRWFRDPDNTQYTPQQVPPFYGDGFGEYSERAFVDLPITRTQYARLHKWAQGEFTPGKKQAPVPFESLSPEAQVKALNEAPLEECLGGPFHPGIELTWPMRVKQMWAAPYRLKVVKEGALPVLDYGPLLSTSIVLSENGPLSESGPGSLTRWLGVPWQTDEASCLSGYTPSTYLSLPSFWAARVPNQVLSDDSYQRMRQGDLNTAQRLKHFDYRPDWLRDFGSNADTRRRRMIKEWHELGIVGPAAGRLPQDSEGWLPGEVWVESERYFSESDPSFQQVIYAEHTREQPDLETIAYILEKEAKEIFEPRIQAAQETFLKEEGFSTDGDEPAKVTADRPRRTLGRQEY